MPLRINGLQLSPLQAFTENIDGATANWPQRFFWTEGLILLNWVQGVEKPLARLDRSAQEAFWQGSIPPQLYKHIPSLFVSWPAVRIVEFCQIWKSSERARTRLIVRACGDHESPKDADSGYALGEIPLDGKKFVIREAAKFKAVNTGGTPDFICKAARENDIRFFIRLGKALQSKDSPPDVDWKRVDPVASFLVDNWCEGRNYNSRLPALCFFTDQALADFCVAAFGRRDGDLSAEAIRKWRKRLELRQARTPKIRRVSFKRNEILFA